MDLWFTATNHSVGQGLMCSGEVSDESGSSLLTYVYDCGSLEANRGAVLRRESDASVGLRREIDVMYISHFDEDHVNGVEILASRRPIKKFVIPATSLAERVIRFGARFSRSATQPTPLDIQLALDPVQGLAEVSPGSEVVSVSETSSPILGDVDDLSVDGEISSSAPDSMGVARVFGGATPVWMLKPWAVPSVVDSSARFLDELGFDDESELYEDIPRLLGCASGRDTVRRAYIEALKDVRRSDVLNFTSLCLYVGPSIDPRNTYRTRRVPTDTLSVRGAPVYLERAERADVGAWRLRPGWIGTGDALLRERGRSRQFAEEYENVGHLVGEMTLPHHGSKRNFSERIMLDQSSSIVLVSSAGIVNKYGHPSPQVLARVAAAGGHVVSVNERSESRFTQVRHVSFG